MSHEILHHNFIILYWPSFTTLLLESSENL